MVKAMSVDCDCGVRDPRYDKKENFQFVSYVLTDI
jgi:hypothetical protein